jgi:hypothetical protein
MDLKVIVRTEIPGRPVTCRGFGGLLMEQKSLVVITSIATPQAVGQALALEGAIIDFLTSLSGATEATAEEMRCNRYPPEMQCHAFGEPQTRKLLVLVGDRDTPATTDNAVVKHWDGRMNGTPTDPSYVCLPVFPAGAHIASSGLLPESFLRLGAAFWTASATETLSRVLQLARVIPEEGRLFISYRRSDTQPLAESLFEELERHRYYPFIDLYSIEPGDDFQEMLYERLADKSFVLALESPSYLQSGWAQKEIDFARIHQLGLLAVNLSNSPKISGVGDERRHFVTLGVNGVLAETELARLMARIKAEHDRALFQRKYSMLNSFLACFSARNSPVPTVLPSGFLSAPKSQFAKLQNDWVFWIAARPPELDDFHFVDRHRNDPTVSFAKMLGPYTAHAAKRAEVMRWLQNKSAIEFYDFGRFGELADSILNGAI